MTATHSALLIATVVLMATAFSEPAKPAEAQPPPGYSYLKYFDLPTRDAKRAIAEIKRAIEVAPKNADHYFNLTVAYALILEPPDIPAATVAYKTALELGAGHDKEFDKLLKAK